MSEFDLRPFEVKKPKAYYYKIWLRNNLPLHGEDYHHNFGLFKHLKDAPLVIEQAIKFINSDSRYDATHMRIELCEDIIKSHIWTFEDIQVGWFFKIGDSIFCKVEKQYAEERFVNGSITFAYSADQFSKYFGPITNVYDCPELAKVLMIERILT